MESATLLGLCLISTTSPNCWRLDLCLNSVRKDKKPTNLACQRNILGCTCKQYHIKHGWIVFYILTTYLQITCTGPSHWRTLLESFDSLANLANQVMMRIPNQSHCCSMNLISPFYSFLGGFFSFSFLMCFFFFWIESTSILSEEPSFLETHPHKNKI